MATSSNKRERRTNRPWRAAVVAKRRDEAEARQRERDARGDAGQLERLDALFGAGQGATKERTRLMHRIGKKAA